MERPSCAEAVGVVCHDLNRMAAEITALQRAKPDVLILHSNTSAVWDGHKYDAAMMKLFTALSFTGLKIGFVTEWQLEQGKPTDTPLLLVPACVHLSDAALKRLTGLGGKILFVGGENLLTKNEYDQPREPHVSGTMMSAGKTWQDTLTTLRPELEKAHIAPAVRVNVADADWGVQWQTARTPEGLIVNLYNARHDPMTVSIAAKDGSDRLDLLTGQRLPASAKITLAPMEVRLLRLPDVK